MIYMLFVLAVCGVLVYLVTCVSSLMDQFRMRSI
jgi:hypothetical protein